MTAMISQRKSAVSLASPMPIAEDKLRKILEEGFKDAKITIKDLVGDQDHYSVEIISDQFNGKSRVQQHKMVNKVLEEELRGELHALQIKTRPE